MAISWLPPIQVNGNLLFFELKVTSATEESIGHNEQLDVSSEPPGDFPNAFGPPMSGKQVLVYLPEDYIEVNSKITFDGHGPLKELNAASRVLKYFFSHR